MEYPEQTLYLSIDGELDQHRATHIIAEIREKIDQTLPKLLVLNLENMPFSDSSGIALLLRVRRQCQQIGGDMKVVKVQNQPRKLFKIAGLSHLIQEE